MVSSKQQSKKGNEGARRKSSNSVNYTGKSAKFKANRTTNVRHQHDEQRRKQSPQRQQYRHNTKLKEYSKETRRDNSRFIHSKRTHNNISSFSNTYNQRNAPVSQNVKREEITQTANYNTYNTTKLNKGVSDVDDIHLAAKISHDLRDSLTRFCAKMSSVKLFDEQLNAFFSLITPTFVNQHLPEEVFSFRSYLCKFQHGIQPMSMYNSFATYSLTSKMEYKISGATASINNINDNNSNSNSNNNNNIIALVKWNEWATSELNKIKKTKKSKWVHSSDNNNNSSSSAHGNEETLDASGSANEDKAETSHKSETRKNLARMMEERAHVRVLLEMSLRHDYIKRKQGQHALVNYISSKLNEEGVDARSLNSLSSTVHHSVLYVLSRLILGMASTDLTMIIFHCHALYLILLRTSITITTILELLDRELALSSRMQAVKIRLQRSSRRTTLNSEKKSNNTITAAATAGSVNKNNSYGKNNNHKSNNHDNDYDYDDDDDDDNDNALDPDEIDDPTRGERNQRLTAGVFTIGAIVASQVGKCVSRQTWIEEKEAIQLVSYLSYLYVEQRATRVTSANILFQVINNCPTIWRSFDATQWMVFAFFYYPKLAYFRPEAIQLIVHLMDLHARKCDLITNNATEQVSYTNNDNDDNANTSNNTIIILPETSQLPEAVAEYVKLDPLHPSMLEQFASALFRKDQVVATHPMVHPVWNQLFALVKCRCAEYGESMKEHLSSIIHNMIVPFKRGSSDLARRTLFKNVVVKLGELAVQTRSAEDRLAMLEMTNKTVGYDKRVTAKSTSVDELRQLPINDLEAKVRDLLLQYTSIKDNDYTAFASRTWTLRELRNCLYVPLPSQLTCTFVDQSVKMLLEYGFYPPTWATRDDVNKNKCIYLFAELFSFTYHASITRPRCTLSGLEIISDYLSAEEAHKTRYTTALKHVAFRKARNRIVKALERPASQRSVLFYEVRDMEILLTLLFLILSVDDASNDEAKSIAETITSDLVYFYTHGSLETLDVFFDALMALIMRSSAPLQVMPLMTCARRVAVGYITRFARFIRNRRTLDYLLSPLREAYSTNAREEAITRKRKTKNSNISDDDDDSDDSISSNGSDDAAADDDNDENVDRDIVHDKLGRHRKGDKAKDKKQKSKESQTNTSTKQNNSNSSESDTEADEVDSSANTVTEDASETDTELESEEEVDNDDNSETETESSESRRIEGEEEEIEDADEGQESDADGMEGVNKQLPQLLEEKEELEEEEEEEEEFEDKDEEDEPATQEYLHALKAMVGDVDLDHVYPNDTTNKTKSDVVRVIKLVTRVGLSLTSPLVVDIYQVLLAICRNTVKESDDVIFTTTLSSIKMLLMSPNRYYGSFLDATYLFQLLGDIQSYSRKLLKTLLNSKKGTNGTSSRETPKSVSQIFSRMRQLKVVALRVFHYLCMIAYKNHASESVRITFVEYYKSFFSDRGWDMRHIQSELKKDMFYYRIAFAWALIEAAVNKFIELSLANSQHKTHVFANCCIFIESIIPRLAGLPQELKASAAKSIITFVKSLTLSEIYTMKPTIVSTYLHLVKLILEYNSKIGLEISWVKREIVDIAIDDDSIQLTSASIRTVASIEKLVGAPSKISETKAPTPLKSLYDLQNSSSSLNESAAKSRTKHKRKDNTISSSPPPPPPPSSSSSSHAAISVPSTYGSTKRAMKRVREKVLKQLLRHRNDEPTDEERSRKRRRKEELKIEDRLQRHAVRRMTAKGKRSKVDVTQEVAPLTRAEREQKRKAIMAAKQERIAKNRARKRRLHELREKSFEKWRRSKLQEAQAVENVTEKERQLSEFAHKIK